MGDKPTVQVIPLAIASVGFSIDLMVLSGNTMDH